MRILFIITVLFFSILTFAQAEEAVESELHIGDTLYFGNCNDGSFKYIDYYKKTRFELDSISFDTINGWAFWKRFFNTGDFDVKRLPCEFEGKYAIIKHMMAIKDENEVLQNAVVAMIIDGSSAAYIIEDAFLNGEVIFAPVR